MVKTSGYLRTSDQHDIHYDQYTQNHTKVVIIAHGFFNSKEAVLLRQMGEALNNEYDVILFDFRGHGESKGLFYWTSKEYLDLLSVIEFASHSYQKIGLIGLSLGASTSIIAASKTKLVSSIIAISTPSDFRKIDYRFWKFDVKNDLFYNLFGQGRFGKGIRPGPFWQKKEKPLDIVKTSNVPIFYIHGEADWLVRDWHSQKLFTYTSATKRLSMIKKGPHAEHLLIQHKEEMLGLIREWFHETLI